jgi:hypothetical protein
MRRVTRSPFRAIGRAGAVALVLLLVACAAPGASQISSEDASPTGTGTGSEVVAQVASFQMVADRPGRLLVALLSIDNRWVSFGSVSFNFVYLGEGDSSSPAAVPMDGVTASFLPIPGTPDGVGKPPTLTFPADGHGVYKADPVTFPRAGYWQVVASGELDDGTPFSAEAAMEVLAVPTVVSVGDVAPHSDNAVIGDEGVPDAAIDSRAASGEPIPDPDLHTTSIADAIDAGHPALVVFSTPVYCVSQFCGPITDLVEQLAAEYSDRADFIHVEIYRDFQTTEINQTVLDWLQTPSGDFREPWTFLIGADGRIAASWDTVVTRGEIEPMLQALPPK